MSEIFKASEKAVALKLPASESLMLKSEEMPWQGCDAPGFWVKPLIEDESQGIRTWLMKVDAGAFSESVQRARGQRLSTPESYTLRELIDGARPPGFGCFLSPSHLPTAAPPYAPNTRNKNGSASMLGNVFSA